MQRVGQKPPEPPYSLDVWCYWAGHQQRDTDNYHKAVPDLLATIFGFDEAYVIGASQRKRVERPWPWFGGGILTRRWKRAEEGTMTDRERPSASGSEEKIPEAWIDQEVMIETTEVLSSDLRAGAPVYLEDVNDRGIVMMVTRHRDQNQFSRYFYPWGVVGWIRLAEDDEKEEERPRDAGPS